MCDIGRDTALNGFVYSENLPPVTLTNAPWETIANWINQLDGITVLMVEIIGTTGRLFLHCSRDSSRVFVMFSNGCDEAGILMDRTQSATDTLYFVMDQGPIDPHTMNETVSRETALEVARYYVEHDGVPATYDWEGIPKTTFRGQ